MSGRNPHVLSGLTWSNFEWAFQAGYASNWHPLTWISHLLDVQLLGLFHDGTTSRAFFFT